MGDGDGSLLASRRCGRLVIVLPRKNSGTRRLKGSQVTIAIESGQGAA
jgi:hypothetical protein